MTLRLAAPCAAALALILTTSPAARVFAWAAGPLAAADSAAAPPRFRPIPLRSPAPAGPHRAAYALMAAGIALTGASFVFESRAARSYDDYLVATEPGRITELYDRTARYDRLASGALVGGQVVFAAGVWARFLHRAAAERMTFAVTRRRCALALSF